MHTWVRNVGVFFANNVPFQATNLRSACFLFSCLQRIDFGVSQNHFFPAEFLNGAIASSRVRCKFSSRGCRVQDKFQNIDQHEQKCDYRDAECADCGLSLFFCVLRNSSLSSQVFKLFIGIFESAPKPSLRAPFVLCKFVESFCHRIMPNNTIFRTNCFAEQSARDCLWRKKHRSNFQKKSSRTFTDFEQLCFAVQITRFNLHWPTFWIPNLWSWSCPDSKFCRSGQGYWSCCIRGQGEAPGWMHRVLGSRNAANKHDTPRKLTRNPGWISFGPIWTMCFGSSISNRNKINFLKKKQFLLERGKKLIPKASTKEKKPLQKHTKKLTFLVNKIQH